MTQSSIVADQMMNEREDLKLEVNDLKLQLHEANKKLEDTKQDLKQATTELEKIKSEYFVVHKKLQTIEMEHGAEIKCYQDEIEELGMKLKAAEKKLMASEHNSVVDNEDIFQDNGFFEDLVKDSLDNKSNGTNENSRTAATTNFLSAPGGARDRRASLALRMGNVGQSDHKDQLLSDTRVRELTDRVAELTQALEDIKMTLRNKIQELDALQSKMKEDSRRLDINKRKLELKDNELEDLRQRILEETNKQSDSVNEFNDELAERDKKIVLLRREIRQLAMKASSVPQPKKAEPAEEIDSGILKAMRSFFN